MNPGLDDVADYSEYADYDPDSVELTVRAGAVSSADGGANAGQDHSPSADAVYDGESCPGGGLDACIDVCPGFHAKAFAICVAECGKRCP